MFLLELVLEIGIKYEIKIILKLIYNVILVNYKIRRKFDLKKKEIFIWNDLIRVERFKGLNWFGKLKKKFDLFDLGGKVEFFMEFLLENIKFYWLER